MINGNYGNERGAFWNQVIRAKHEKAREGWAT